MTDKQITDNMSAYGTYIHFYKLHPEVVIIIRMPNEYVLFDESADKAAQYVLNPTSQTTEGAARSTRFAFGDLDIVLPAIIRAGYRVAFADYK